MSWQLQALKFYLRYRVRNRLRADMDVSLVRTMMEKTTARFPPPPPHVRILPVMAGGRPAEWVEVDDGRPVLEVPVIMYLHGGGFVCGSPKTHRAMTWRLAEAAGARVFALDYRLAPEHPCPAGIDDAVVAYRWLLERQGISPTRIALAGDSAGGGLAIAMLHRLKAEGLPMPASMVGFAPWVDLEMSGDSLTFNADNDPLLQPHFTKPAAEVYRAGGDDIALLASPLNGDHSGLPPTLLQVGSTEILLDDSRRLAAELRKAGVDVTIEIWPDFPHVAQMFAFFLPEGRDALAGAGQFIAKHWKTAEIVDQVKPPAAPAPTVLKAA